MHTFVLFDGGELAGMSSFLGIEPDRGVLEIGGTYYRPHLRGTGFNRRVKDMMLRRAFDCGYRRIEFRVDARNARSQAAMAKLGATPRRRAARRPDHLERPRPRHRAVLDPARTNGWPKAVSTRRCSALSSAAIEEQHMTEKKGHGSITAQKANAKAANEGKSNPRKSSAAQAGARQEGRQGGGEEVNWTPACAGVQGRRWPSSISTMPR